MSMARWQPIETAPKDGTKILAYDPDRGGSCEILYWGSWKGKGAWQDDEANGYYEPSHWMPLPEPPQQDRGDEK